MTNKTRGEKEKKSGQTRRFVPFFSQGERERKNKSPGFFFSPFSWFFFSKKILDAGLFSFFFLMIMSLCFFFKLLLKGDQGRRGGGIDLRQERNTFFSARPALLLFFGGLHLIPRPFCFSPLLHPTYGAGVEGAGRGGGEGHYIQCTHIHNIEEIIQNHFCKFFL